MSKRSYGLQPIDQKLTDLLKPIFQGSKKEFVIINSLVKNWEEIVGKKYAKLCYPKAISFGASKSEGKLTIAVYNSAVGFFLESNSELIIERIAAFYGFKSIARIIIKQEPTELVFTKKPIEKLSPEKERFLQESLSGVEDVELAEVLKKIGRVINSKH